MVGLRFGLRPSQIGGHANCFKDKQLEEFKTLKLSPHSNVLHFFKFYYYSRTVLMQICY
jgi:hypothetical protein